jgi:hypothetical protein
LLRRQEQAARNDTQSGYFDLCNIAPEVVTTELIHNSQNYYKAFATKPMAGIFISYREINIPQIFVHRVTASASGLPACRGIQRCGELASLPACLTAPKTTPKTCD